MSVVLVRLDSYRAAIAAQQRRAWASAKCSFSMNAHRLLGLEDRETAYKKLLTTPNLVLNLASNRNLSIW